MIWKRLTLPEMEEIYHTHMAADFPPDEIKPFSSITAMVQNQEYEGFGLFFREELRGYAFCVISHTEEKAVLLDYLAVVRGYRDEGLGSRILSHLRCQYGSVPVFLESENPAFAKDADSLETRNRRLAFYSRNLAVDTGIRSRVFGVEYVVLQLMEEESRPDKETAGRHLTDIYHTMFRPEWMGNKVVIHPYR